MVLKSVFIITKLLLTVIVVILYIHYFFPQTWGYFTKEPLQPLITVYKIDSSVTGKEPFLMNNMSYGMGVSRKGKILFNQLMKLLNTDKNFKWLPFNDDSLSYITQHGNYTLALIDNNDNNIIPGKFVVIKTDRPTSAILKNQEKFVPRKQYTLADIRVK